MLTYAHRKATEGFTVSTDKLGRGADLGTELRRKREAAGFRNQQELADRLFCDRTMITKIETAKSVPTDDMVTARVEACGFDPGAYLLLARHGRRPGAAPRGSSRSGSTGETRTPRRE